MSKGYKFSLILICILILGCVALGINYLFFDRDISEETIVLVDGNLSINYMDGNIVKSQDINDFEMNFSVTNNSKEFSSYSVNLVDVKNKTDNINVSLVNVTTNSVVVDDKFPNDDINLINDIQIASGETHNFVLKVKGNDNVEFEAVLKINEEKPKIETFAQTLLKNNAVSNTTLTKVGEELAIENEGLISDIDDSGSTYYFRGAIENNYVSFASLTWRIVRINGDGTVKLILNSAIDTVQAFYTTAEGEFYTYEASNLKSYLASWYEYNLINFDDYIALDKYCNDYNTTNSTDNIYSSYVRVITNKIPTFNCLGRNLGAKIGVLSADEAVYAGALYQTNNTSYYLYNKNVVNGWWTMTPATGNSTSMNPFIITTEGALEANVVGNYNRGVRPVISLVKDISVTGKGTVEEPYTIKLEDK